MSSIVQSVGQFADNAQGLIGRSHTVRLLLVWGAITLLALVAVIVVLIARAQSAMQPHLDTSGVSATAPHQSAIIMSHTSALNSQIAQSSAPSSGSAPTASTRVTVNGQNIPLPQSGNGTVHQTVTSDNGNQASVDVNVRTTSSSDSSSSSNLTLNVDSDQVSTNNSE